MLPSRNQLELYQQVIMDHNRKPRNFGKMECCSHQAEGLNPLCGDHLWVYLNIDEGGFIQGVGFEGNGCAISKASASIMTTLVKGKTVGEAKDLFESFSAMLKGTMASEDELERLGKLKVFSGVSRYPSRIKCAVLPWHALQGAMNQKNVVSTE